MQYDNLPIHYDFRDDGNIVKGYTIIRQLDTNIEETADTDKRLKELLASDPDPTFGWKLAYTYPKGFRYSIACCGEYAFLGKCYILQKIVGNEYKNYILCEDARMLPATFEIVEENSNDDTRQ